MNLENVIDVFELQKKYEERITQLEAENTAHRQALTDIANTIDPVEGMTGGPEAVAIIIACIKSGMEALQRVPELEALLKEAAKDTERFSDLEILWRQTDIGIEISRDSSGEMIVDVSTCDMELQGPSLRQAIDAVREAISKEVKSGQ